MHAYDETYLPKAKRTMGEMLDYAVYGAGWQIGDFYQMFLASPISLSFAVGDPAVLAGRSGIELAWLVAEDCGNDPAALPSPSPDLTARSPEYWAGWALAHFQWSVGLSFAAIDEAVGIECIRDLYHPFHEMDITSLCLEMHRRMVQAQGQTNLARLRKQAGLSQGELALISGVSVRTIQHYEQRRKSINHASLDQVLQLARALGCAAEALHEPLDAGRYEYEFVTL